jgi:hypothetical protein
VASSGEAFHWSRYHPGGKPGPISRSNDPVACRQDRVTAGNVRSGRTLDLGFRRDDDRRGYRVIQFWNGDVMEDIEGVPETTIGGLKISLAALKGSEGNEGGDV